MASVESTYPVPEAIYFYEKPFDLFSNFTAYQVEFEGRVWPTTEHLYHAHKFWGEERRDDLADLVFAARSAHAAFKLARSLSAEVRPDWDEVKVDVMYGVCRLKLEQHPHVRDRLEESGDRDIIENSPSDSFWGIGPDGKGRNELGKVWMKLREEMRQGLITPTTE